MKIDVNLGHIAGFLAVVVMLAFERDAKLADASIMHAFLLILFVRVLWWRE